MIRHDSVSSSVLSTCCCGIRTFCVGKIADAIMQSVYNVLNKTKQLLVLSSAAPINALTSSIKLTVIYMNFLLFLVSIFLSDFVTRPAIGPKQRIYRGYIVQQLYVISLLSAVKVCDHCSDTLREFAHRLLEAVKLPVSAPRVAGNCTATWKERQRTRSLLDNEKWIRSSFAPSVFP